MKIERIAWKKTKNVLEILYIKYKSYAIISTKTEVIPWKSK